MRVTVAPVQAVSSRKVIISVCSALIAFLAYSSVYAYRKPFSVARFEGISFWGVSYQTLLIISQVFGYMGSKFYGIKFIAELKRLNRWKTIAWVTGIAWFCLLLLALVPPPFGMIFMFINGFMLGFMWGIVFSYIEGRRATDFIGTVMAVSFIFAGGFTRSVGRWLIVDFKIAENWMPFFVGLIFALPLLLFVYLLEKLPPPDDDDIRERTGRLPMKKEDRRKFLKTFTGGVVLVATTYVFLTILRDLRDNYMANIWNELGYGNDASILTTTETITSVILLFIIGLLAIVRKSVQALRMAHWIIAGGIVLAGLSSWLFMHHFINGAVWMQLVGLGLYMGYIPFNCVFFERLIATFRVAGNVGFLIYLVDAFGYMGSVAVMLVKEFMNVNIKWSQFYANGAVYVSVLAAAATVFSYFYFDKKYQKQKHGIL